MTSTTAKQVSKNGKPASRLRRWLLAIGATLVVASGGFIFLQRTSDEAVRTAAKEQFGSYLNGVVDIGTASVHWDGRIELNDVRIWAPSNQPHHKDDPAFSCKRLELFAELSSFVIGSPKIHSIVAHAPKCRIVRDRASGLTNLSAMLHSSRSKSTTNWSALPSVELRDAQLIVVDQDQHTYRVIEELSLAVRARPALNQPPIYDITWRRTDSASDTEGHMQFNGQLGTFRNINGGLPWLSLEAVLIGVNANYDGASAWSNLLGLSGKVRAVDFDFGSPDEPGADRSATLQLIDASLSIPVNAAEYLLPRDERYLYFKEVTGSVELRTNDIIATFSGLLHGSSCSMKIVLRGGDTTIRSLDDVELDLELAASNLKLPRRDSLAPDYERRFVGQWKQVDRFYEVYEPRGRFDIKLHVTKKAGVESGVSLKRLSLRPKHATAKCIFFPYELTELTGEVVIDAAGVRLNDLTGRHGSSTVVVKGSLSEPKRCASVDLDIQGTTVQLEDNGLRDALKPQWKTLVNQLDAKGIVDIGVSLHRDACKDDELNRWQSDIDVSLRDVHVRYVRFPLDAEDLTGSVHIQGHRFDIVDVKGKTNGADLSLSGSADLNDQSISDLTLNIQAHHLTVNDELLSALPSGWQQSLKPWQPAGQADVTGTLNFTDREHQISYDFVVGLDGCEVTPPVIPVIISDIKGIMLLKPGVVELDNVTAKYKKASLAADGLLARSTASPQDHLSVTCTDLIFDDELLNKMPAELQPMLKYWHTDSPIALQVSVPTISENNTNNKKASVDITLANATVLHDTFTVPFENVDATISFDGQALTGNVSRGRYGSADISLSFSQDLDDSQHRGTYKIAVANLLLDRSLRALLPPALRAVWDSIELDGACDLNMAPLKIWRSDDGRQLWSVDGDLQLKKTSMFGLARMREIGGSIEFGGMLQDQLGGSTLRGKLNLKNLSLYGHTLSPIRADWSITRSSSGDGQLMIEDINGLAYNGAVAGHLDVRFDKKQTDYSLWATALRLDITQLFEDTNPLSQTSSPPKPKGFADARLYLSGTMGVEDSVRGGGRIQLKDGSIYRLPLLLAILPVLNLSMPEENAFDYAEGEFLVLGTQLQFERILLQGNVIALLGSGTLSMPDQGLDLNLVHISSSTWTRLPAITDLLEGASRELLELHVTGPLSQPIVHARPLRRLTDELKRLFKRPKAKPVVSPTG